MPVEVAACIRVLNISIGDMVAAAATRAIAPASKGAYESGILFRIGEDGFHRSAS